MDIRRSSRPWFTIAVGVAAAVMAAGCAAAPEEADVAQEDEALVHLEVDVAREMDPPGYYDDGDTDNLGDVLNPDGYWGRGGYLGNGDYVYVQDTKHDGQSVGVNWQVLGSNGEVLRQGICRNGQGAGPQRWCNKDFPEAHTLKVRLGQCDGSKSSCDRLSQWHSWTGWRTGKT